MSLSNSIALIRLCRPKHWLKNLLVFAPLRPGLVLLIPQQPPVQDQVNVLGKPLDQAEAFGQAGTALEGQVRRPGATMEEVVQRPADPKILFHDSRAHTAFLCCVSEQYLSLNRGKSTYIFHSDLSHS